MEIDLLIAKLLRRAGVRRIDVELGKAEPLRKWLEDGEKQVVEKSRVYQKLEGTSPYKSSYIVYGLEINELNFTEG